MNHMSYIRNTICMQKAIISICIICTILLTDGYIYAADTDDPITIGLNYPQTGPYSAQGLDEMRAVKLAQEEINENGGILGKRVNVVYRDTQSDPVRASTNARELILNEKVVMILGGASSAVAVAVSEVCQELKTIFLATITASNETTVERAHRHTFRVCYNAWMGAKALGLYLQNQYAGKRFFYITADYTWGWSSEASLRKFTGTEDTTVHKGVRVPSPGATDADLQKVIALAKIVHPDVLVLVLFGKDMSSAIRLATMMGLKTDTQIVVPILELGFASEAGPRVMEGVIGTADWNWQVPYMYHYQKGIDFVERFTARYDRYPCWGAATAYTNMMAYKQAVERAGTFNSAAVIRALEGAAFTILKDQQEWREFDHQCVQSVYVVQCKKEAEVLKNPLGLDYFDVLMRYTGQQVVQTFDEWVASRTAAQQPSFLETLDSES